MPRQHLDTDNFFALLSISGATVGSWLVNNALGIIVGLGGLCVQIYFNYRKDRREQQLYERHNHRNDEKK